MRLLLSLLILSFVSSIYIPLSSNKQKCMVAFSFSEQQSLKLELKFPQVPRQDEYNEIYTISLRNSQTNETQYQNIKYGVFKRQLKIESQIIYHICFKFISNRVMDGIRVQYSAVTHFYYTPIEMNIPQNILKQKDLAQTYRTAVQTQQVSDKFQQMQQKRTYLQDKIFAETKKIGSRLINLSIFQLIGIFILGGLQVFVIRGIVTNKIVF